LNDYWIVLHLSRVLSARIIQRSESSDHYLADCPSRTWWQRLFEVS